MLHISWSGHTVFFGTWHISLAGVVLYRYDLFIDLFKWRICWQLYSCIRPLSSRYLWHTAMTKVSHNYVMPTHPHHTVPISVCYCCSTIFISASYLDDWLGTCLCLLILRWQDAGMRGRCFCITLYELIQLMCGWTVQGDTANRWNESNCSVRSRGCIKCSFVAV